MFNRNSSIGPCSSIFRCSVCFIAGYAFTGWRFQRHCVDFHPQILGVDDVAARLKRPSTSPQLCLIYPNLEQCFSERASHKFGSESRIRGPSPSKILFSPASHGSQVWELHGANDHWASSFQNRISIAGWFHCWERSWRSSLKKNSWGEAR